MDFTLPPQIEDVRRRTRAFVEEHVLPLEADRGNYDEHEAFGQHNVASHRDLVAAFRVRDRRGVSRIMREHMCCAESFMQRLDASFRSDLLSTG